MTTFGLSLKMRFSGCNRLPRIIDASCWNATRCSRGIRKNSDASLHAGRNSYEFHYLSVNNPGYVADAACVGMQRNIGLRLGWRNGWSVKIAMPAVSCTSDVLGTAWEGRPTSLVGTRGNARITD